MQNQFWQGGVLNKAAQRQLFEDYGQRLYLVAYRYLGERMAAEDATAETFVKVFAHLPKMTFDHKHLFEAWLRRIVINKALERLRQRKRWRREQTDFQEQIQDGEEDMLHLFSLEEVLLLMEDMPEGYRTVLQLYAFDEFTHKEIASALKISVGTSKSQLNKARNFLKRRMNKSKAV